MEHKRKSVVGRLVGKIFFLEKRHRTPRCSGRQSLPLPAQLRASTSGAATTTRERCHRHTGGAAAKSWKVLASPGTALSY